MAYKERFIDTLVTDVLQPINHDLVIRWMLRRSVTFHPSDDGRTKIELVSENHPSIIIQLNPRTDDQTPVTFHIGTEPRHRASHIIFSQQLHRVIPANRIFDSVLVKNLSNVVIQRYDVSDDGTVGHFDYASTPHSGSIPSGALQMPGYRAPRIQKSHFRSSVKTGNRSLRSQNYTGSGSQKKLRNGITMMELEDTASSRPPTMVYVKNDPTKLLAPLESWKQLPGQVHPLTRHPLGHSDLRKVKTLGKIIKKKK